MELVIFAGDSGEWKDRGRGWCVHLPTANTLLISTMRRFGLLSCREVGVFRCERIVVEMREKKR